MSEPRSIRCPRRGALLALLAVLAASPLPVLSAPEAGAEDAWPEKGPRWEGRTLVFPHHNLRWRIPEDLPVEWRYVAPDESVTKGCLFDAQVVEADGVFRVVLAVELLPRSPDMERVDPASVPPVGRHALDETDEEKTEVAVHAPIGNYEGLAVSKSGRKRGSQALYRQHMVYLHGESFVIEAMATGAPGVAARLWPSAEAFLAGAEWVDTTPWVLGPWHVPGTAPADRPRGGGAGQVSRVVAEGIEAVKPAEMSDAPVDAEVAGPIFRFAWEHFAEDHRSYMYFEAHSCPLRSLRGAKSFAEQAIRARLDALRGMVDPAALHVTTRGGTPWFPGALRGARGLGYELRLLVRGGPCVERGLVVKGRKYWYTFRYQFVGEGAEERCEGLVRQIERSLDLQ